MSIHVLYPFNFTSSVHFGDTVLGGQLDTVTLTCGADTLFSALCNEASWQSNGLVEYFIDQIRQGHISFSSLFPLNADPPIYSKVSGNSTFLKLLTLNA